MSDTQDTGNDGEPKEKREEADQFGHPRIPYRGHYSKEDCNGRRKWVEKFSSCSLEQCGQWWLREGSNDSCSCLKLKGNVENVIGLSKIPLGICGPLLFKGEHVHGYRLCPMSTTEGALVASVTRGATALTRSGGAYAKVIDQSQIRSPYFMLRSITEVDTFLQWIASNFESIKLKVGLVSQHAQLKAIDSTRLGRAVIVHFHYTTGKACGQNMTTSCTHTLCQWIQSSMEKELLQVKIVRHFIDTGLSGDKKIGFINHWRTRGFHVQAEGWIPNKILKSVLKVDILSLIACYEAFRSSMLAAGVIGFTLNISNLITGVFIATGQDVAAVESCHAQLTMHPLTLSQWKDLGKSVSEDIDATEFYGGVYASIMIPSLCVGTVGGGTALATQKECLDIICRDGKKDDDVLQLCEVIAAYALALELSTLSAMASGQFATAHEKLGRNHPSYGLKQEDLNTEFFSEVLGDRGKLINVTPFDVDTGNSIISDFTKNEVGKTVGHFGFTIKYTTNTGHEESIVTVIKSKTTALEVCNMLNKIAQACGLNLATQYNKYKMKTGLDDCDIREIEVYQMKEFEMFFPKIYFTLLKPSKEVFAVVMEYMSDEKYSHLNSVNDIGMWTTDHIKIVLKDLALFHAVYFDSTSKLETFSWLKKRIKLSDMTPLWKELLNHAHYEFPEFWTRGRINTAEQVIEKLSYIDSTLEAAPVTFIHNDCNPRNMCLRKIDGGGDVNFPVGDDAVRMCLYDLELATIDTPQRDLVEFLAFTLEPGVSLDAWSQLVIYYRNCLQQYSGSVYPLERFIEVLKCAAWDFVMRRLLMYTMAHTLKDYTFLPRVVSSMFTYLDYLGTIGIISDQSKL